jgi:hypothetical protein
MADNLLQLVNDTESQSGLPLSTTVYNTTNQQTRQLLGLLIQLGRDLRRRIEWPQLNKQYQFNLISVGSYTGDTTSGVATISNLSSTTGITVGMIIVGSGWDGIGSAGNQVRVVSISGNTVTTNVAASTTQTGGDYYFSQDQYALPADFDEAVQRTHWDRTNRWELVGPLLPQEWQWYKSGIITQTPRRRFRIAGLQDNKFSIDPPPMVSENGQYLAFEYQTKSWIKPVVWTTATSFAALSFCSYNGNIYQTTLGGTSGSTPPVHLSGAVSDGGVSWTFYSDSYERFMADTDLPLLDYDLLVSGLKWYWRREKRLAYQDLEQEWENKVSARATGLRGSRIVNMEPNARPSWLLGYPNIPDTGYGATTP